MPRLDARGRIALETGTLNVQIPKGVREGQMIRLAGQGAPVQGEGPPGDLLGRASPSCPPLPGTATHGPIGLPDCMIDQRATAA